MLALPSAGGLIGIVGAGGFWACQQDVDLPSTEPGCCHIELKHIFRKKLELLRQQPFVPCRALGQPVVGQNEGPYLGLREVLKANRGHLRHAQQPGRLNAAVAGYKTVVVVYKNWSIEPEFLDTSSNLTYLYPRMQARVPRPCLEPTDRS